MFGDKIKKFRKEHGYSMDKMCSIYNERFGGRLNKSTLSRYENGLQDPMISTVKNMAELLDITVSELTETEKEKPVLDSEEQALLERFRKLSSEDRELALQLLSKLGQS